MVSGTMITAIRKVHASKGPWVTEGGYEYNAVILAAMFAITEHGPGSLSVDRALLPRLKGTGWAVLQLAAAAAGSYLTTEKLNEAPPEQATAPQVVEQATDEPRFEREQSPASTTA
jgi:putative oxidoreductase